MIRFCSALPSLIVCGYKIVCRGVLNWRNFKLCGGGVKSIGAEKVPGAPGRRGKLGLTRGNFVIPEKGTEIFS